MIDVFGFPVGSNTSKEWLFTGFTDFPSGTSATRNYIWEKPKNAKMFFFYVRGGGGGGGDGGAAGTTLAGGGGGGGSSTITYSLIPSFLLPDTLYLQVGNGGYSSVAGRATNIRVGNASGVAILSSNGGGAGGSANTSGSGGATGVGGSAVNAANLLGLAQSFAGQNGITGGTSGTAGGPVTQTAQHPAAGGAGGGGVSSTTTRAGGAGTCWDGSLVPGGAAGANSASAIAGSGTPAMYVSGKGGWGNPASGGGSAVGNLVFPSSRPGPGGGYVGANAAQIGNGANSVYGAGGGGGGGNIVFSGGSGGQGGPGCVYIVAW